jgi:hypothetical protein
VIACDTRHSGGACFVRGICGNGRRRRGISARFVHSVLPRGTYIVVVFILAGIVLWVGIESRVVPLHCADEVVKSMPRVKERLKLL